MADRGGWRFRSPPAASASIAVDAQAEYLARASAAARAAHVELDLLDLRLGDMAEYQLEEEVDGALCMFTSFGCFADPDRDQRVLAAAYRALRRGGRFLLETAHRDGVVRLMRIREAEAPDGRRWREEPAFDPVAGVLEARWSVTLGTETRSFTSRMRPYSATELDAMLRAAGFRQVAFYAGLAGGPPSLDHYEVVAVATK